jgi:hypothetical protein
VCVATLCDSSMGVACVVLMIVGLGLIGPYSLLSGTFAIDLGGKQGGVAVCVAPLMCGGVTVCVQMRDLYVGFPTLPATRVPCL